MWFRKWLHEAKNHLILFRPAFTLPASACSSTACYTLLWISGVWGFCSDCHLQNDTLEVSVWNFQTVFAPFLLLYLTSTFMLQQTPTTFYCCGAWPHSVACVFRTISGESSLLYLCLAERTTWGWHRKTAYILLHTLPCRNNFTFPVVLFSSLDICFC